jgi:lytic cellulose monooxygenase (C1-hydroxylating)
MLPYPLLALFASITGTVSSHGFVSQITVDGVTYTGGNPNNIYQSPKPSVPFWFTSNLDNSFVAPDSFNTSDIICHKSATPGTSYATVAAGGKLTIIWNTWPVSHVGSIIDYIASCGSTGCLSVDKTTLSFIKIDAAAWKSGYNPGKWVTDDLITATPKYSWTITIPSSLAAGTYVLRHEIIAIHAASGANGAQAYPQCINLNVTGFGTQTISGGKSATRFYTPTDPGIKFDIYSQFSSYTIPGPAVKSFSASIRRLAHAWA